MKKQAFTRYLANDQFEDLFIELGWNDYDGDRLLYPADVERRFVSLPTNTCASIMSQGR